MRLTLNREVGAVPMELGYQVPVPVYSYKVEQLQQDHLGRLILVSALPWEGWRPPFISVLHNRGN